MEIFLVGLPAAQDKNLFTYSFVYIFCWLINWLLLFFLQVAFCQLFMKVSEEKDIVKVFWSFGNFDFWSLDFTLWPGVGVGRKAAILSLNSERLFINVTGVP